MSSEESIVFEPSADPITPAIRKRVKLYFLARGPDRPKQVLYFGAPAMGLLIFGALAGMPRGLVAVLSILGAVAFAVAAALAVWALRRASEREVDIVISSDVERVQYLALELAQLTEADLRHPEPCVFRNARSERDFGGAYLGNKLGKDELRRWTPIDVTSVHFGHHQLFVYRCAIDLTTGEAVYEDTREISYTDIVSVVTHTERLTKSIPKDKKKDVIKYWRQRGATLVGTTMQLDGLLTVSLQLGNGEELEIARWEGVRDGVQPPEAPVQIATTARLRSMVRESKQRAAATSRGPRIVRHPSTGS